MKSFTHLFTVSLMLTLVNVTLQAGKETGMNHLSTSSPPSSPKSRSSVLDINQQATMFADNKGGARHGTKTSGRMITPTSVSEGKKESLRTNTQVNDEKIAVIRKKDRQPSVVTGRRTA